MVLRIIRSEVLVCRRWKDYGSLLLNLLTPLKTLPTSNGDDYARSRGESDIIKGLHSSRTKGLEYHQWNGTGAIIRIQSLFPRRERLGGGEINFPRRKELFYLKWNNTGYEKSNNRSLMTFIKLKQYVWSR